MIALVKTISWLMDAIFYVIMTHVIISWLPSVQGTKFAKVIDNLADPFLTPARALLHTLLPVRRRWMFDLSPVVAILLLQALFRLILRVLVMIV